MTKDSRVFSRVVSAETSSAENKKLDEIPALHTRLSVVCRLQSFLCVPVCSYTCIPLAQTANMTRQSLAAAGAEPHSFVIKI